jgi:hypothetical protein
MMKFKTALALLGYLMLSANLSAQTVDHSTMDHASHMATMGDTQRQAEVSERGQDVMPFSLDATTHIFIENQAGGIQQVVAKNPSDATQVSFIREHLQEIRDQFLKGNFSAPSQIHGQNMPGLATLKAATAGQIMIDYKNIEGGAQLTYRSANADLILALHQWFDAQLSDHGNDAMSGHGNQAGMMKH